MPQFAVAFNPIQLYFRNPPEKILHFEWRWDQAVSTQ